MWLLIKKLWRIRLLSPVGFYYILKAIFTEGINLMSLLRIAMELHHERVALWDEEEELTYQLLHQQSKNLAIQLAQNQFIKAQDKVAIACRNHASMLRAMFAVSRLGAHVYLVNPEMSAEQVANLIEKYGLQFIIYDENLESFIQESALKNHCLPAYHAQIPSVNSLSKLSNDGTFKLKRAYKGQLVVLTGGTTGTPKSASRKPSVFKFLAPFFALLTQVNLDNYKSVYIATPAYHGFGVSSVFISAILGAKMYCTPRFNAQKACALIAQYQIEVVTLVPLMLQRMLEHNAAQLTSIQCFISGGAPLSPQLATTTLEQLGDKLFNLYGSSEAGFCMMASPENLRKAPNSIGKPIAGVHLKLLDESGKEVPKGSVGRVSIKSSWTITAQQWVETGDLAYQDTQTNLFYLCGRIDDMIASGGEKVYPIELENVLSQHPDLLQVAVIGVADAEFGQRLKAFVVKKPTSLIDETALFIWLKPKVARFQMPVAIEFREELPYTALGKVNKKALR